MSSKRTWTRSELPAALERALGAAVERGAKAPVILRLNEIAGYTDWVLLVSARSERQVRGVVDGITEVLASSETRLIGTDGLDHYLWALLDYDDFLIHVFYHPVRKHYDLESMWSDAPRVELGLPTEVMDLADLEGLTAPEPMPSYRGDFAFGGFDDEFVDEDYDDEDEALEDHDEPDDALLDEDDDEDERRSMAVGSETSTETSPDDDLFEP